jgi:AAA+ ATPase superfamily predicted ATPase
MKFFNREREIKEIISILEGEPNSIYFIYGSINSGKTTLINHIINEKLKNSNKKKYAIFYVNFREYDISSMDNFVEALFEIDESSKENKIKSYIEYFTKGVNDISNLYYGIKIPEPLLDRLFGEKEKGRLVFKFIRDLFISLNNKGIQPVFILDELQMIKDIAMNGGRPLLKSLFQFLVSLTKERHLAHCLCLTSDSLFAEYVYNTGELEDRADYILVDDFDKPTAIEFMDFLAKELLNKPLLKEQKEQIYSLVGGKPILIYKVIDKIRYKELNDILTTMLNDERNKLRYFL